MHPKVTTDNIIYSEYTWKLGKQERFDLEVDFELGSKIWWDPSIQYAGFQHIPSQGTGSKIRRFFAFLEIASHPESGVGQEASEALGPSHRQLLVYWDHHQIPRGSRNRARAVHGFQKMVIFGLSRKNWKIIVGDHDLNSREF